MLLRLWHDERPRTVLVAWDTLDIPTYRHNALEAYQSGRVFEDELARAARSPPGARRAPPGFAYAKEPGYEADDFLAAAAAQEEAAGGTALVATSDRDAFQLVSER